MANSTESSGARPVGSEVLVLEKDHQLAETLGDLLTSAGLQVTAFSDAERAKGMVRDKFFSVAILDMDTPGDWQGLELMRESQRSSPATRVIILTQRETFERSIQAFRSGAHDVISKRSQNVEYIADRTRTFCEQAARQDQRKHLLQETSDFLEVFLKRLMDSHRRVWQAEGKLTSRPGLQDTEFRVLVVDDNHATSKGLSEALEKGAYHCMGVPTGGEALDYAGQNEVHMALVKEELPDLPGKIVAKSLLELTAGGLVLMFSDDHNGPGKVSLVEGNRVTVLVKELTAGTQLLEQIHRLKEAHGAKKMERRFLENFRTSNNKFLKRYVELRKNIEDLSESD